jgi:hypothetical protein
MPRADSDISAVIPMHNEERCIAAKLLNLLESAKLLREIIVVDDASTDSSPRIVEALASRHPLIRLVRNARNRGANAAANEGARQARGTWLYMSSANDLVMPDYFDRAGALLRRHPEAGACCAFGAELDDAGHLVRRGGSPRQAARGDRFFRPEELRARHLRPFFWFAAPAIIFRMEAFLGEGGFDEKAESCADGLLLQILALKHGLCFVCDYAGLFRNNPSDRASYMKSCFLDRRRSGAMLRHIEEALRSPPRRDFIPEAAARAILSRIRYSVLCLRWDLAGVRLLARLGEVPGGRPLARIARPVWAGLGLLVKTTLFLGLRPGDAWCVLAGRLRGRRASARRLRAMSDYWRLSVGRQGEKSRRTWSVDVASPP